MAPLLEVRNLVKDYPLKTGIIATLAGRAEVAHAVSDVSLQIQPGEIVGVVGESGSGKTTLGKVLVSLERPTAGTISFDGQSLDVLRKQDKRGFHRRIQMIFQDPYDTLNPRQTILGNVVQPLRYLNLGASSAEQRARAIQALELVELLPAEMFTSRYPHQLSGGQRQRVAIARALIVEPQFLVADEPVSMLDVSIRAGILNLLKRVNTELGIAMMLITHDLTTAYFLSRRIAVMYLGKIVELNAAKDLITAPRHPYTQLLLASAPDLIRPTGKRRPLSGEAANAMTPPKGCRFSPRCPHALNVCREVEPPPAASGGGIVACHRADELLPK